jgi:hypothetical protein
MTILPKGSKGIWKNVVLNVGTQNYKNMALLLYTAISHFCGINSFLLY